jgi:hypothetical protein
MKPKDIVARWVFIALLCFIGVVVTLVYIAQSQGLI